MELRSEASSKMVRSQEIAFFRQAVFRRDCPFAIQSILVAELGGFVRNMESYTSWGL